MPQSRWTFAVSFGQTGLDALAPSWRTLSDSLPALDFVQTLDWAQAYVEHLAPFPDDVLWVTAHEGDRLVLVLPLERMRPAGDVIRMLTHAHMTLADVVAHPDAAPVWPSLWHWLQHESDLPWSRLVIYKLSAASVLSSWLDRAPSRLALSQVNDGCAVLDCDRDYEALLKSASAKHRSNLSRGAKRAEQIGALRYECHADPQSLDKAMSHFLDVEASGWKGSEGGAVACQNELISFYRQLASNLASRGQCEIDLLWLDDRAIATAFWFRTGGQLHLQKIAYLEQLANLSPGMLILREALKRACADPSLRRVSFITRCPWADGWRTSVTPVWTHSLFRESWRGRLMFELRRCVRQVKGNAKPLVSALRSGAQALVSGRPTSRN